MADFEERSSELRDEFTDAFQTSTDPLKAYEAIFEQLESDPFELFISDALLQCNLTDRTVVQYRIAYRQWREFMATVGRHPACPNDEHVRAFARWLQVEQDNGAIETIKQKLHKLNRAYRFWQHEPALPHTQHYNPFILARETIRWNRFEDTDDKSPPPISPQRLRTILGQVSDIRAQLPVATQLKLGLRVGELRNIQLQDIHLEYPALKRHYPSLGTHPRICDHPNAIYIPGKDERSGNKSAVPRILPLDEELQQAFAQYLRIRPTCVDAWFFVSKYFSRIDLNTINEAWKGAFHPAYAESDEYRAVTSHFGRHYFTSYWRKEQDLPKELVQYMRGDRLGEPESADSWMHHYLHVYYEDIEERYRNDIYTLGLQEDSC
jgi:integrase/recombinase XerD